MEDAKRTMSGIVKAGYVCLLMSVIILPYLFGLAAFVLGIVATAREQRHGVILTVRNWTHFRSEMWERYEVDV